MCRVVKGRKPLAELYWWIALGYPPFDMGKDAFPRTGQIVKYYRERKKDHNGKPYTQSALAHVLHISEQCMRDIENRDLAMDHQRRHFLSEILGIPPILFGIITLDEIQNLVERAQKVNNSVTIVSTPKRTGVKLVVDVEEYREKIVSYWKTDNTSTAYSTLADTQLRIDALYRELPHVRNEQPQLQELLFEYHQFVANLHRDQQNYAGSIEHLDKALLFAEHLDKAELKARVHYSQGYISYSAHRIDDALCDFNAARQYENKLPDYLNGPTRMYIGEVAAKSVKQDRKTKQKSALPLLDSGGKMARSHEGKENPYFIDFSLDRYHLTKASALIAIGMNQDAIDELELVNSGSPYLRRNVYKDILLAQASINKGQYSEGISSAESALDIVLEIDSKVNLTRIMKIYHQLQKSPYKNSPDVARLGYLLRRNGPVKSHQ